LTPIERRLLDALRDVEDPELPVSVVDLGLIVALSYRADDRTALVKLTFTAMGCPAMEMIVDDVRQRLLREPDVERVEVETVWAPAWTSERVSTEGRRRLRRVGVAL
jgi:metal-sulfur cluster biosynthetic enzyme